jgi:hypothetical protein
VYLCAERGRFLFEARPDLFPEGYVTDTELLIWGEYYQERGEAAKAMERKHG